MMPFRIDVQFGNDKYGTFLVKRYQLSASK
jgi:hypothetical protein